MGQGDAAQVVRLRRPGEPPSSEGGRQQERQGGTTSPLDALAVRQSQFLNALLQQVFDRKSPRFPNPAQAAREIGVPDRQAGAWGRMMLESPVVSGALARQLRARLESVQATPELWLAEVFRLAHLTPPTLRDFYRPDGTLLPPSEWTEEMSAEVAELTTKWETGLRDGESVPVRVDKIRLHDHKAARRAALDLLARYHKIVADVLVKVVGDPDRPVEHRHTYDGLTAEEAARAYRERVRGDGDSGVRH